MSPPLLEITDLAVEIATRRGTVHAVDSVSLQVERGEALGLVGESGCGKSITLRAILGLLPRGARIVRGAVLFNGTDLVRMTESRLNEVRGRHISMIFQEPMTALNPVMRVGDQIAEGPWTHLGQSRGAAYRTAIELMKLVGIPDPGRRARAYPHELSGGMRQRVMIAIALSCHPELILCDEPTTALDVTIQEQILRVLTDLCANLGVGLLFVTHDLAVVAQTVTRVAVMYAGKIVEAGQVPETFRSPRHPYTLGLLRSLPDFENVQATLVPIEGAPPDLVQPPLGCRFHPRCPFVRDDCRRGEFPLRQVSASRATACIHDEECIRSVREHPILSIV